MSWASLEALLCESKLAHNLPDLWAALFYGDDPPAPQQMVQMVLDDLSRPARPQDAFRELLKSGELAAAKALMEHRAFRSNISNAELELLDAELAAAHHAQVQDAEVRCELLRNRSRCALVPMGEMEKKLDSVKERAVIRRRDAELLTAGIEADLCRRETQVKAKLRQELFEQLRGFDASDPVVQEWQSRLVNELDKQKADLCLAHWILKTGPERGVPKLLFSSPRRLQWPYSSTPREVCAWFRGQGEPTDFGRWRIQEGDQKAAELLAALEALVDDPTRSTILAVTSFVVALEAWLGCSAPARRLVEEEGKCFLTTTSALFESRIPVLAKSDGLPLVVATGVPLSSLTRLPSRTFLLFELHPMVGKPKYCLSFDPELIFRLLGDSKHHQRNFLRALVPQIPMSSLFEDCLPEPHPMAVIGREREIETIRQCPLSLVVGPRGIGKTSLLCQAAHAFEAEGWITIWLSEAVATAGRIHEELGRFHSSGRPPEAGAITPQWLEDLEPPGIFVAVEGDTLMRQADGGSALARFIGTLTAAGSARLRCAVTRLPRQRSEGNLFQNVAHESIYLGPLPYGAVRDLLKEFEDLIHLSFENRDLRDRLAFYSGGHPTIFYLLFIEVVQRQGIRAQYGRPALGPGDLQAAWRGSRFRRRCQEILLTQVREHEELRFALDCLIQLTEGEELSSGVLRSEMKDWLEIEGYSADMLPLLVDEGLAVLDETESTPRMRLPPSGIAHLIRELLRTDSSGEGLKASTPGPP